MAHLPYTRTELINLFKQAKDINNRTAADKILRDKAHEIAKEPKYYGSQRGLASMVYKFFDKKTVASSLYFKMNN